ncbi:hypothetical protein M432DRAFT_641420 [Thermoascus aurantiacus ATCC 26904]
MKVISLVAAFACLFPSALSSAMAAEPGQDYQHFSYSVQEQLQLQRVFDGVNGCSITDEQDLWHPGPGIIPEDDNVPDDLVTG